MFAYCAVPQDTTEFSPFELLYGREVRGSLDLLEEVLEANKNSDKSVVSHILLVHEWMEEMSELVEENVGAVQMRQKKWYDQTARERENFNQMKRYLCCCLRALRTIPYTTKGG